MAFVLFLDRESAHNCARAVNNKQVSLFHIKAISFYILYVSAYKLQSQGQWFFFDAYSVVSFFFVSQLFGRTVKASIAIDNGRATEFIRRRNYTDKTKCYECGVSAYLSFFCVLRDCYILLNYSCKYNLFLPSNHRIQVTWATHAPKTFWERGNLRRKKKRKRRKRPSNLSMCTYCKADTVRCCVIDVIFCNSYVFYCIVKKKKKVRKRERTQP